MSNDRNVFSLYEYRDRGTYLYREQPQEELKHLFNRPYSQSFALEWHGDTHGIGTIHVPDGSRYMVAHVTTHDEIRYIGFPLEARKLIHDNRRVELDSGLFVHGNLA